jgi:YVTN family beta-propeller protein
MMRRLALLPFALAALAAACADQKMTAPLRAAAARPSFTVSPTPERTFAYVANTGSDNVSVIRTSDNTVVATIAVGDEPHAIAITPSGGRVYVANRSSDNVSVIRTSDNTVMATIPVGHFPQDVAAAPEGGRVYVMNSDEGTVSVIRTSDNTVVATIQVADDASAMAITPDGSELYVNGTVTTAAAPPFGTVTLSSTSVIRTSDYTLRDATPGSLGSAPVDVAITPDGSRAYLPVSSAFPPHSSLQVIQTSDLSVVTSLTLPGLFGPGLVGITPNGADAYVMQPGFAGFGAACTPGGVWIIPTATNTIAATVAVTGGCFPRDVAFTPDGSRAYVTTQAESGPGSVTLIGTSARAVVGNVAVGDAPNGVAIGFVPTPNQLIIELQGLVSDLDLPGGLEGSLLTKLSSALTAIQAGKIHGACGALQDFVSQVTAISGKKITTADATQLIDLANQTRELIGC